ncbi:MAG: hypothetical protein HC936_10135 [Leptolyngbyaceae cyanobacterium SU_3_3]|nr:hypothetical protein [Leptolyngbyaceae cyanobacterium SU_3_3]
MTAMASVNRLRSNILLFMRTKFLPMNIFNRIPQPRLVRAGDNLPLLCYQIYGDPLLYLQVAQANGIAIELGNSHCTICARRTRRSSPGPSVG